MGCFDVWCVLCGCPFYNRFALVEKPIHPDELDTKMRANKYKSMLEEYDYQMTVYKWKLRFAKFTKWLPKATAMIHNKRPIHDLREVDCNIGFEKKGFSEGIMPYDPNYKSEWSKITVPGFVCHTDCWKYAKKEFNHELVFEDFDIKKLMNSVPYTLKKLNYRPANKYWAQHFDDELLAENESDYYILHSPLSNTSEGRKNTKRIGANIKDILKAAKPRPKAKKLKPNRPSPSESATLFKLGHKKKGNDGNMYIIVQNKNKIKRWKKI